MENKKIKIVAHMYGDMWVEPFKRLVDDNLIELNSTFLTLFSLSNQISNDFNSTTFIAHDDLQNGDILTHYPNSLDKNFDILELYKFLTQYDVLVTAMTKRDRRIKGKDIYIDWKVRYIKIVNGIANMLQHEKPDIVFFSEIPHGYGAYLLYLVAKFFNIRTLTLVMPLELTGRIYTIDSIENINTFVQSDLNQIDNLPNNIDLPEYVELALQKIKGDYNSGKPAYVKTYTKVGSIKFISIKHLNIIYKKIKWRRDMNIDVKASLSERIYRRYAFIKWQKKLAKTYAKHSKKPDYNSKYIYYAMHYQPEQTSLPMADYFENQYMTLSLLSKHLPQGWKIYVKENPYQFISLNPYQKNFKSIFYYQEISKIQNVELISMSVNSFQLIDKAEAVATLTGMSGWEAINRGKPVLCFGFASYRFCEGVYPINNKEETLVDAIKHIEDGVTIDTTKIRHYLSLLHKHSSRGILKDHQYEIYNIPKQENCDAWYTQIKKKLIHKQNLQNNLC